MGVEPTSKAWEAFILPMNYARIPYIILKNHRNARLFCRSAAHIGRSVFNNVQNPAQPGQNGGCAASIGAVGVNAAQPRLPHDLHGGVFVKRPAARQPQAQKLVEDAVFQNGFGQCKPALPQIHTEKLRAARRQ